MNLTPADLQMFARLGVGAELLEQAGVVRVTDPEARERYGVNGTGDRAGIIFPYFDPLIIGKCVTCRLRRDRPDIEDGKEVKKYMAPHGDRRHLYFVPGCAEHIYDIAVPVVLVEAEKSALALTASAERTSHEILPVGMGGCWSWRGRIGKVENAHGERVDEVGPLPDLLRVCTTGRTVYILLDANFATNSLVRSARSALVHVLQKHEANVRILDLPAVDGVNGPDDYLAVAGDEAMAELFEQARGAALSPQFSEDELALRFSSEYAESLRYTAAWGKWFRWDGARWREDDTLDVFDRVRAICRAASAECAPDKEKATKVRLAVAATVAAVERLARSDRRHAATVEQWDSHPWLLNTPSGTVDLRTGKLQPAKPGDYITRCTAVAPSMKVPELWFKVLHRITGGDLERVRYLQRVGGYALTGSVKEEALFFAYGAGGNGKDVFFGTLQRILADYAQSAAMEMFCVSKNDRHPTELAALRGARLITATETERGRTWAESRIKMLTGGNRIRAHFMHRDDFEFEPEFKLILYGNYKPSLRGVTESVRRRFHIIPFDQTISPEERDTELKQKLVAEWPGILQWFIEGCLEWQRIGLADPTSVSAATKDYLDGQDATALWVEENVEFESSAFTPISRIGANYREWCDRQGRQAQDVNALVDELIANYPEQNLERKRDRIDGRQQRGLRGLRLRGEQKEV